MERSLSMINREFIKNVMELRDMSYRVSPESFHKVATILYGMSMSESQDLLSRFNDFSIGKGVYYSYEPEFAIDDIMKAIEIIEKSMRLDSESDNMHSINFYDGVDHNYNKMMCYFVKRGDKVTRHELNLSVPTSYRIISELMDEPETRILCAVECVDCLGKNVSGYVDIDGSVGNESLMVYDGDIFVTYNKSDNSYWNKPGDNGVYVAIDGAYRRLLYTEGRGYINKDKEPNVVDEDEAKQGDILEFTDNRRFSSYVLSLDHKWTRIGNIHVDVDCLMEKNIRKEEAEQQTNN